MIPILYGATDTDFSINGIGPMTDAISCFVWEERNGGFELEMEYPVTGDKFQDITIRNIIRAKTSPGGRIEPFRIYKFTAHSKGTVKIYAQHISYDLSGIPVAPYNAANAADAIRKLKTYMTVQNNFTFATDVNQSAYFAFGKPTSARSLLGGSEGSILGVYQGEWNYTGFNVSLLSSRGSDRGVKITYGKNIQKLENEMGSSMLFTGVLPYYYSDATGLIQGQVQNVPIAYGFTYIIPVDLTEKFDEPPTVAQLNAQGVLYIQENNYGLPEVSMKVNFADISSASGFEEMHNLETVELCDTVTVEYEELGAVGSAQIIKTTYDVLKERYVEIEIGDKKEKVTNTIASQAIALNGVPSKTSVEKAIAIATELITGALGGYVLMHDSDGDGKPDEILIMDTDNIDTATKVWRWNKNGLGYSSNGYEGPYGLAMTINGSIVADFVNTGTLNANNVNVENINGENIRNQTIGNAKIASGAVDGNSLAYGVNTTLAQVGVNSSSIATLYNQYVDLASRVASIQAGYFYSISTSQIAFGDYALFVDTGDGNRVKGIYIG